MTAKIKTESVGRLFDIKKGLRQEDPLSPKLFSATLELVFRNLEWTQYGIKINGSTLSHLGFADDRIIISDNQDHLQTMLEQLEDENETELTTVHVPNRVIALRGIKNLGKMSSAERDTLVTVAVAISALGNMVPPFFIFSTACVKKTVNEEGAVEDVHLYAKNSRDSAAYRRSALNELLPQIRCLEEFQLTL
ncbi:Retrovirus-related Pol polyprotein from type-1 retrotransposable element R2 [Eumeta japonica]|uniref:Retrovirus-related Pol polyprotein from type-1 retrotransposable element R2 n=1 Tax=Eumeta variegata TaxID=151549 RepID=A0A4C1TZL3_EUMVA|nr:Retrovirus-related Pol polyprotein from type-1 retrotransposable element R2 [Eumeta japonica]